VTSAAQNLDDALELADIAERMVRARLRREQPELNAEALAERMDAWLHDRPGAVDRDAEGRRVELRRRKKT
jgi:hypothetical protein